MPPLPPDPPLFPLLPPPLLPDFPLELLEELPWLWPPWLWPPWLWPAEELLEELELPLLPPLPPLLPDLLLLELDVKQSMKPNEKSLLLLLELPAPLLPDLLVLLLLRGMQGVGGRAEGGSFTSVSPTVYLSLTEIAMLDTKTEHMKWKQMRNIPARG